MSNKRKVVFSINDQGHCRLCTRPDDIQDLVQCDKCDRWFHFGCAKLEKLPETTEPWLCIQCDADYMEILQLKKELMAIQTELGARAKAQKGAELHATSLELELDNVKQELENKEKEEDTRQDILKGLANVLQSSRKVSDPAMSEASKPTAVSEARAISIMMKRQLQILPTFCGEAREWPAFKRRFIETSQSGEYTDSENIIRLQQALSGKAARSVQALMLDPSNVQQIIDRLEKQFGQFRKIHRELREEIERIRPSGPGTIIEITDALENLVSHLTAMKQEEYLRDPRLMDDIASKLPYEQQIKWMEFNHTAVKTVTLKDLLQFLKPRADIQREMSRQPFERRNRINVHQEARDRCYLCNGAHTIKECHQFKKLTPWERHKRIRSIQACFMCLIKHNGVCRSEQRCGIMGCQGKHHKMLHFTQFPRSRNEENMKNNPKGTENKPAVVLTNLHYQFRTQVFYQIIPVTLRNNGYHVETFAFIDPGSSLTLVDKQVTNQLRLEGIPDPLKITWTQNYSKIEESSERVKFKIMGSNLKEYSLDEVRTVENLQLPMQTVDYQDMCADFPYLSRLPISSYKRARPRILIGLNHSHSMLPMNKRSSGPNKPMAIETPLGWLIFGNITEGVHENHVMMIKEEEKMHEMMKNYFSTEEFGVRVPERLPESKESIRAKEIVDKTLKYDGNRYEIGLLWKQDDFKFPESYTQAHKVKRLIKKISM